VAKGTPLQLPLWCDSGPLHAVRPGVADACGSLLVDSSYKSCNLLSGSRCGVLEKNKVRRVFLVAAFLFAWAGAFDFGFSL
jgi:hypothetical protein